MDPLTTLDPLIWSALIGGAFDLAKQFLAALLARRDQRPRPVRGDDTDGQREAPSAEPPTGPGAPGKRRP